MRLVSRERRVTVPKARCNKLAWIKFWQGHLMSRIFCWRRKTLHFNRPLHCRACSCRTPSTSLKVYFLKLVIKFGAVIIQLFPESWSIKAMWLKTQFTRRVISGRGFSPSKLGVEQWTREGAIVSRVSSSEDLAQSIRAMPWHRALNVKSR